jgi:hypothetical protein
VQSLLAVYDSLVFWSETYCTGTVVGVPAPTRSVACIMTGVGTGVAGVAVARRGSPAGAYAGDPGER